MSATSVGCLQRLTGCSSLIILLRFIPSIQRKSWAFYEYVMEQVDVSVVVVCHLLIFLYRYFLRAQQQIAPEASAHRDPTPL